MSSTDLGRCSFRHKCDNAHCQSRTFSDVLERDSFGCMVTLRTCAGVEAARHSYLRGYREFGMVVVRGGGGGALDINR